MSSILPVPSPSPLLPAVFCHIVAFCRPFVAHILTTTPARSVTVTKPFSPHTVTLQKAVTFSPQSSTSEIDDTKSCKELVLPHKKLEFVKCGTCKEDLGKASFSKAQLRKKKNAKCKQCMGGLVPEACVVCGTAAAFRCASCQLAPYCSKKCQKQHWQSGHKQACGKSDPVCEICLRASRKKTLQTRPDGHTYHLECQDVLTTIIYRFANSLPDTESSVSASALELCVLDRFAALEANSASASVEELAEHCRLLLARASLNSGTNESGWTHGSTMCNVSLSKEASKMLSSAAKMAKVWMEKCPTDCEAVHAATAALSMGGHADKAIKILNDALLGAFPDDPHMLYVSGNARRESKGSSVLGYSTSIVFWERCVTVCDDIIEEARVSGQPLGIATAAAALGHLSGNTTLAFIGSLFNLGDALLIGSDTDSAGYRRGIDLLHRVISLTLAQSSHFESDGARKSRVGLALMKQGFVYTR
jgi:hypothetical protein